MWYRTISCDIGRLWYHSQIVISHYDIICIPSLHHIMISYVISWFSDGDIIIMWYHSQTMISHFKLWYHIWCHICISCDVAAYHMWCHTVISQCDITIMWYHSKILWYHMWNHRQQRDTSYVISHSFFPYHMWHHMWHHSVISYVMSHNITLWCHMWCHILVVGSSSRPARAISGCAAPKNAAQQAAASVEWSRLQKNQTAGMCHVQKRNGPDKPDQRHPKNQILCHWTSPMKNFNWIKVLNLGRTWRWLCRPWLDEANCDMQRIIGSAETS